MKKGVLLFLLVLTIWMIYSEFGELPAGLYGIFMGWKLGEGD